MTIDSYEALLGAQGQRCACCGGRFLESRRPVIDCDRARVRGLICARCALTLRSAGNNSETLERCAQYLRGAYALQHTADSAYAVERTQWEDEPF